MTDTSMVEKVARAIAESIMAQSVIAITAEKTPHDFWQKPEPSMFEIAARAAIAAIAAMREPTEAMKTAMKGVILDMGDGYAHQITYEADVLDLFHAAIDEALKPTT